MILAPGLRLAKINDSTRRMCQCDFTNVASKPSRLPRLRLFLSFPSKFVLSYDENHVRLEIDMPSQEDMDLCTDKVLSKGRILQELTKAVKLVSAVYFNVEKTYQGHTSSVYIYIYIYICTFLSRILIYIELLTFYSPMKFFLND